MKDRARAIVEEVGDHVEARFADERRGSGVVVDFATLSLPGGAAALRAMPLVKACGRDLANAGATLVDATAGLGYDAYLLALAGFSVTAIERSTDVARLALDAMRRAKAPFKLVVGDSRAALASLKPDVIYL